MQYQVYVTVWDAPYVAKFLEFSLPTQLAAGNLPAMAAEADVTYNIYTDRLSGALFEPALASIEAVAKVRFHYFDEVGSQGETVAEIIAKADAKIVKHLVQGITAHHLLDAMAPMKDAAVVLLDSDFILSDGSLATIHALRKEGKKAVAAVLLRLLEEDAAPRLREFLAPGNGQGGSISGRDLVALAQGAMHPALRSCFVDAEEFTLYPTQLNWPVGDHGFVTHCCFPHPMMVIPDDGASRYFSTMDYEYLLRAVADNSAIHLCRDSDAVLVCKMSPRRYLSGRPGGEKLNFDMFARFVVNNTNIRHQQFLRQPVRYIAGGGEDEWKSVEEMTAKYIAATYKAVELLLSKVPAGDAKNMLFLKSFLGSIEMYMSPAVHSLLRPWFPKGGKGE